VFYEVRDLDLGFSPLSMRRACLYSEGRVVDGAMALITCVKIRAVGVGNRPTSRYEPSVSGERGRLPLMHALRRETI
jgi:hypothetical protein